MSTTRVAGLLVALLLAAATLVVRAADDECGPPRCTGIAPTFVTTDVPVLQLGRDVTLKLRIVGNNDGAYHSSTGPAPTAKGSRAISLGLATDQLNNQSLRDLQQRVGITFGTCVVAQKATTCDLTLRGKVVGPVLIPIKALDNCVRGGCPAQSGKLKHSYTTVTFSARIDY